eukprot:TRINITY_DN11551_c0_g1_i1.p3 TRINITY_DN11551_c0_g1~~TRINITY_DN11551_c0_g1_i1.p3  ORF type:complete len:199 (-),score=-22.90 TRINITY_DN11551_c0_g1_i1:141-737(-)
MVGGAPRRWADRRPLSRPRYEPPPTSLQGGREAPGGYRELARVTIAAVQMRAEVETAHAPVALPPWRMACADYRRGVRQEGTNDLLGEDWRRGSAGSVGRTGRGRSGGLCSTWRECVPQHNADRCGFGREGHAMADGVEPRAGLVAAIEKVRKSAQQVRDRKAPIGEAQTKAALVDPVLVALGWDTTDLEEVLSLIHI